MNSLKYALGLYLLATVLLTSCSSSRHASTKRLPGNWQQQPIVIDGDSKDWPNPYPEYDPKAMLGYCVTNDAKYLYITVETGDPGTQMKILKNGLTVWIDKTGGKEQVMAINYPIPVSHTDNVADKERDAKTALMLKSLPKDKVKRRAELLDLVHSGIINAEDFSLQGFKACNEQFALAQGDSCGIIVRMAIDADGELVWEARVPFRTFYPKPEIDNRDKGRPLSILIETDGIKRPQGFGNSNGGRNGGGGMRPSIGIGMGGMGVGMGNGGYRGNNRGPAQENVSDLDGLFSNSLTRKKFGIAWVKEDVKK